MTTEQLWYRSYVNGEPPRARRMSRLPMQQQFDLTIDLAISTAQGVAGWRTVFISKTREQWWYWPHPLSESGWWLIPERIAQRVTVLREKAIIEAFRCIPGPTINEATDAVRVMRRWKRRKTWRKHAASVTPRRQLIPRQKERRKLLDKRSG